MYLLLTFAITFVLLILLLKTPLVTIALDRPNERSLHSRVTPRTGGIAIVASITIVWALMGQVYFWIAPLLLLLAVSLVDDMRGLPVILRLLAQLAVSAGFVTVVLSGSSWWPVILAVLTITWMINLYNFMDGADGLAGGMALFGFSSYAVAAYIAGNMQFAMMNGTIAVASTAFLLFNFYPARIFLGDAGSVPLGFLAGAIGLFGWKQNFWPSWFPLLVFSPFIIDASVTLLKRLLHGEKLWEAHRNHYYQRVIQMHWGHGKIAICEYILMCAVGISAVLLLSQSAITTKIVLIGWLLMYSLLIWLIDKQWIAKKNAGFNSE